MVRSWGLQFWNFGTLKLEGAKCDNCTDLGHQSGYGQVMGSAVLELWNFGVDQNSKVQKLHRPRFPEWL